jgi:hypothetical protein
MIPLASSSAACEPEPSHESESFIIWLRAAGMTSWRSLLASDVKFSAASPRESSFTCTHPALVMVWPPYSLSSGVIGTGHHPTVFRE